MHFSSLRRVATALPARRCRSCSLVRATRRLLAFAVSDVQQLTTLSPTKWEAHMQSMNGAFDLDWKSRGHGAHLDSSDVDVCDVVGRVTENGKHERRFESFGIATSPSRRLGPPIIRSISAVFDNGDAFFLNAYRPAVYHGHGDERNDAMIIDGGKSLEVADARLSTVYSKDDLHTQASLELWLHDDEFPRRITGEAIAGNPRGADRPRRGAGLLQLDDGSAQWHRLLRDRTGRSATPRRLGCHPPMSVRVIISDFGGVLTNPLEEAFLAYQEDSGIALEELGLAMFKIAERDGENPLYVLEKGQMTYPRFEEVMQEQLRSQLGDDVQFADFAEGYFNALHPNQPFLDFLFDYKAGGGRLALLTNNVKEWEPRWRAMLPIDELFETIVDSGFVGTRKPEPRIYEITYEQISHLEGLHDVKPEECVLVDDIEINCEAAREFGFQAVRYHGGNDAVLDELGTLL